MRGKHRIAGLLFLCVMALIGVLGLPGCAQRLVPGEDSATLQSGIMQARLAEMIGAFEAEDLPAIESMVDRNIAGYQRFIEGVRTDLGRYAQIRLTFTDIQATALHGGGVISARFEKRFVRSDDSVPGAVVGHTRIVFRKRGQDWIITGIDEDNPFVSPATP